MRIDARGFERNPAQKLPQVSASHDPKRRARYRRKRLLPDDGLIERRFGATILDRHAAGFACQAAGGLVESRFEVLRDLKLQDLTPGQRFAIALRSRRIACDLIWETRERCRPMISAISRRVNSSKK